MRPLATLVLALAIWIPSSVNASGTLGIFGIIERVELEPDAAQPERIRLYGAFAFYDGHSAAPLRAAAAARGQLYFVLSPLNADPGTDRREWADLAAVAGTGAAVAFAQYSYLGSFIDEAGQAAQVLEKWPASSRSEALREAVRNVPGVTSADGTINFAHNDLRLLPVTSTGGAPVIYQPAGVGVVRLGAGNYDEIIRSLRAALAQ
jgi:hypothetical protein